MNRRTWIARCAVVAGLLAASSCASTSAPPATAARPAPAVGYPVPEIPATVVIATPVRDQHMAAAARLQAGDARAAAKAFGDILKKNPQFYPAQAGLGLAQLASRQYKNANANFTTVLAVNDRYLPAWIGQGEALLGLGRDTEAVSAMERALALDPRLEAVRTRLELVRFRLTQGLIESGRKARTAGKLDEAETQLEQALALSPQSTMILHELSLVEVAARSFDEAELHARKAAEIEPREPEWQAALGAVLEQREKYREASAAYGRAAAMDPRPEWKARSSELREKAELAALPAEFARLTRADSITRADVAAYVGIHLEALIAAAPRRVADVATDVRTHWAAPWILPVTRAGVMTIFPNHTFQPGATVRRSDLAAVVAALVRLAGGSRPEDLAHWQAARPRFADLPASHVSYPAAALAVAAGAMAPDEGGRFQPARQARGAELDTAVKRVAELASR
jgi:tetratricopeptide (TPR) repeat protein